MTNKITHYQLLSDIVKNNPILDVLYWAKINVSTSYTSNYPLSEKIQKDMLEIIESVKLPEKVSLSYKKVFNDKKSQKEFFIDIITYDGSNVFITGLDEVVKRKSKNNPKTIRVKDILTENDKAVIEDLAERARIDFNFLYRNAYKTAEELLLKELSKKDYYKDFEPMFEINKRKMEFKSLKSVEEKKQWLKENGYRNWELYGYHEVFGEKHGHTYGASAAVDHKEKVVFTEGWSSDD